MTDGGALAWGFRATGHVQVQRDSVPSEVAQPAACTYWGSSRALQGLQGGAATSGIRKSARSTWELGGTLAGRSVIPDAVRCVTGTGTARGAGGGHMLFSRIQGQSASEQSREKSTAKYPLQLIAVYGVFWSKQIAPRRMSFVIGKMPFCLYMYCKPCATTTGTFLYSLPL